MEWLRKAVIVVSTVGAILSVLGYGAVHFGRDYLEDGAREIVTSRTEQKVRELIAPRPVEGEGRFAKLRNGAVELASKAMTHALGDNYPDRLRQRVGELCVCRMSPDDMAKTQIAYKAAKQDIERVIEAALSRKLSEAKLAPGTFRALIDGYYMDTVEGLARDLRVFFGLNILLYLMAGAIAWFGGVSRSMLAPAGLLLLSNIVAGYGYVFNANWLSAIVLNAWTGYSYLITVAMFFIYYSYKLWIIQTRMRMMRAAGG